MGLNDIISAKARQVLYAMYAFLGIGLGAVQVAYAAAEAGQPVWLTVALAVFAFLGTALGFTAAANTRAAASDPVHVDPTGATRLPPDIGTGI